MSLPPRSHASYRYRQYIESQAAIQGVPETTIAWIPLVAGIGGRAGDPDVQRHRHVTAILLFRPLAIGQPCTTPCPLRLAHPVGRADACFPERLG